MGNMLTCNIAEDSNSNNGQQSDFNYIIRIGLIGDCNVGKSKLLKLMVGGSYNEDEYELDMSAADFRIEKLIVNQQRVKIQFWDIVGTERFTPVIRPYLRPLHSFIIIYQISNRQSFERVSSHWLNLIQEEQPNSTPERIILVGAKCDLNHKRQVSELEGKQLADDMGWSFVEISNRNSINISVLNEMVMEKMKNIVDELMDNEWVKV